MNVAIIDSYHFEVTYTLIALFDKDDNKITIFVHHLAYQQLLFMLAGKETRYTWIVKNENNSNREFIGQIFLHLREHQFELLYFNTIEDNFILYAFYIRHLKNIKKVLTLHDVNGFFHYQPSLSIRRLVRYIGKKRLLKIFPNFNVLSETLKVNLQSKLKAVKKIYTIPGSYFDSGDIIPVKLDPGNPIKIVIPGSVDERRRDYSVVKEFLEAALLQNKAIEICLLGGFTPGHSESTRRFCQNYFRYNSNLKIFEEDIVDHPVFEKYIQESHFVWMPVQPMLSIADGITEEYGKSICSGNIGDVIRYARPFFVPRRMPLDEVLQHSAIRYDSLADILTVIQKLSPSVYAGLQKNAWNASLHYTKEKIIEKNLDLFG